MRILFCNKYNYPFSGTEAYIFDAMELLRANGHETALFSMADEKGQPTPFDRHFVRHIDFKRQMGWFRRLALVPRTIYSRDARQRIRAVIEEFQPHIAHVRNIYHHLTPAILWELKTRHIPVVYHLNDFKPLCPSYNFVSHGEACEACKGGKFWRAMEQRCYPGWGARATLVAEAYAHKWLGTYRKCVDCFLAPSEFVRAKFVEHGWDSRKFEVLPHFQRPAAAISRPDDNAPLLYFGRLSREKGIEDLLHAMQQTPDLRLIIAGDGPDRGRLEGIALALKLKNLQFTGSLRGTELDEVIAQSQFSVLPSHAYETFGKTILESYAHGRAVIASDMGSRRELVHSSKTGLLYKPGEVEELVSRIRFLTSHRELAEQMGTAGLEFVREKYSPEAHYQALIRLYERLAHLEKPSRRLSRSLPSKEVAAHTSLDRDGFVPWRRFAPGPTPRHESHLPAAEIRDRTLRVAFIGGRGIVSKYSGIETYYEEVGRRLAASGHKITAYCRTYFTPPGAEYMGIKLVRLPTIRSKHLETLVHTALSTGHALASGCDIVHYHALGPALFSFIPRLIGKKTVVTVQGLDWQRAKWGRIASIVLRIGERAAASFPNDTIVVSRALQKRYRTVHDAETHCVPNGGLLRDRRPPYHIFNWGLEPEKYILFLGRFSPEKGCHVLLEAFEQLKTDVKLVMAGASSYCDDYSRQLREHACEQVILLDWVSGDALDELLTNAMIFVLPSEMEGLSLALLDAMGAGLCVISSDVPENREALEEAGFTFRCGDAADLANRLRFLISNPAVREAAGIAAKERVREHYLWSKIASEIEQVYFETMGWERPAVLARKPNVRVSEPSRAASRGAR